MSGAGPALLHACSLSSDAGLALIPAHDHLAGGWDDTNATLASDSIDVFLIVLIVLFN